MAKMKKKRKALNRSRAQKPTQATKLAGGRWYGWLLVGIAAGGIYLGNLAARHPEVLSFRPPAVADSAETPPYQAKAVSPDSLMAELSRPEGPMIIDVRAPDMFAVNRLPWAHNIPLQHDGIDLAKVPLGVALALYCS